jgi:hypothetical protein
VRRGPSGRPASPSRRAAPLTTAAGNPAEPLTATRPVSWNERCTGSGIGLRGPGIFPAAPLTAQREGLAIAPWHGGYQMTAHFTLPAQADVRAGLRPRLGGGFFPDGDQLAPLRGVSDVGTALRAPPARTPELARRR